MGESEVGGDGEVGVEFGIKLVDAGKKDFGEFDGRELAGAEKFCDFRDGGEGEVGAEHGCTRVRCGWEFNTENTAGTEKKKQVVMPRNCTGIFEKSRSLARSG